MLEVLSLHAMRQIDVPANFILTLDVSNEKNSCQSSISKILLSVSQSLQEWLVLGKSNTLRCQDFNLCVLLVFPSLCCGLLPRLELLTSDNLGLTHESHFVQLPGKLLIFKVEQSPW